MSCFLIHFSHILFSYIFLIQFSHSLSAFIESSSFLHLIVIDPFTTTLGILTAISMVMGSVVTFTKAIEDLRAHYKTVQDLWDELIALETVLRSLKKVCESDPTQFSLLVFPLERCGQVCEEFSLVIKKCIVHSDGSRPSVRDWAMLKYMGNDISGFLRMLDGHCKNSNLRPVHGIPQK